jgi:hypothetical protein
MTGAKKAFKQNKADVERLLEIHQDVGGSGPGRKHGLEVLNKSAIVFVTAAWEAYVEDVASEAFELLLNGDTAPNDWPGKVRGLVSRTLRDSKDDLALWNLAGTGWKDVLRDHRTAIYERWVGKLDTPKAQKVTELFSDLLGLTSIRSSWSWQGMSPEKAAAKLDAYITVRGAIAHRTKFDDAIGKGWVRDYLAHVERLVDATDAAVRAHVKKITSSSS